MSENISQGECKNTEGVKIKRIGVHIQIIFSDCILLLIKLNQLNLNQK